MAPPWVIQRIQDILLSITSLTSTVNTKANIAGPIFTGIPQAPTAAISVNTDQLAT